MKGILATVFFGFVYCIAFSQSNDELMSINRKAKVIFVKPETLDKLLIDLRKFEDPINHSQDSLILDTYDAIATGYMANNHFKRAYEIYNKLLTRKEEMLSEDRIVSIKAANNTYESRQQVDEKRVMELQDSLNTITSDNESLLSGRESFKRNFSFLLIFLTAIFAVMLVTAGIQMMNIRSALQKNRERIKSIHRVSLIGKYGNGLMVSLTSSLMRISELIKDLQQQLKKHDQGIASVKQANQSLTAADKYLKETMIKSESK